MDTPTQQPNNLEPRLRQDFGGQAKKSWFSAHHLLGYVFLLAVVGAVISGIYYWQTVSHLPVYVVPTHRSGQSDVPSDWQTYTNDQYEFEFKYPQNLEITEEIDRQDFALNPDDPNAQTFDWFTLNLADARDRQIFNFLLSINHPGTGFEGSDTVSNTSMKIDGVIASKQILEINTGEYKGDKSALYQFGKGNNGYMIYATGTYEVADTILSTFKFINDTYNQPVIIYPKNNDVIAESGFHVTGKASPNYYIYGYINYLDEDLKCLTSNSLANGGTTRVDASGNFDLQVPPSAYKNGANSIVVAAVSQIPQGCFSSTSTSTKVIFTYNGPLLSPQ